MAAKVEAEVLFRSFDTGIDERKARGLQLSGLWVNECQGDCTAANIDMLMSRVGRYPSRAEAPDAWSGVIADSNAP